jgi:formate hydrogenlyase transcriptional activator
MKNFIKYIQIVTHSIIESTTKLGFLKKCTQLVQDELHGVKLSFLLEADEQATAKGICVSLEGFGVAVFSPVEAFEGLQAEEGETLRQLMLAGLKSMQRLEKVAALSRRANEERSFLQRDPHPTLIAESVAMKAVLEASRKVAAHDTTVFLRGESGSGKEVLARYIHQQSRRAHKPFITLNCGALPTTLIESTLFGHERGAFTGANERHRGFFERAEGGTLFLDEIAELPLALQVKLLRVLQEKEFERLGAEQGIKTNVRVLAATHRNIEEMVSHGEFRADLYYRLHTFPLVLPPLRERPEDILPLALLLLRKATEKLNKAYIPFSSRQESQLLSYHWPGNIRELENILERAVILSEEGSLVLPTLQQSPLTPNCQQLPETFEEASRRSLQQAMKSCHGKIYGKDGAAALLGLNPSTLQSKLKKLKLRYT